MITRFLLMFLTFGAVVGVLGFYKFHQIQASIAQSAAFAPPPTVVTTVTASLQEWQQTSNTIGTFTSVRGVRVSAEVPGKVIKLHFDSGARVKEGDLLVELDVEVEKAQLAAAEARAALAQANLKRYQGLSGSGAVSSSDIDEAEANLKQNLAEADALRATIARKTIKAPFDGILGIRRVQLGQYLSAGDEIVTLVSHNPIYLDFSLPQQALATIETGQLVRAFVDAYGDRPFEGTITAINAELDEATRSIKIRALLENSDGLLRPGMFARVNVVNRAKETFLTLPATAISRAPYGDSVFVVEKMAAPNGGPEYLGVRQAFVRTGPTRGDQVAVLEGIKEGMEVVTSGLFKLRPGAPVEVNNEIQPGNNPAPTPADS
jgi:membrane fusion protein (multidrug efflux system)